MAVRVLATGVHLRAATPHEAEVVEDARHGREPRFEPPRSCMVEPPGRPLAQDEVYVVSQAFVEFTDGETTYERWTSYERHGHRVSLRTDATLPLLKLARDTEEDLVDLLADMRIGGLGVSRWALLSAPRRIELQPELEARLAPLRRG